MKREFVNYTIEESIATVIIDHPPMNTIDLQTRRELTNAFEEISSRREEIRVAILASTTEKVFVSGADIKRFLNLTSETCWETLDAARLGGLAIEQCAVPVICAIKGYCLGGGLEIALCCDIRIAAESAKFGQPEVNLSIIPGAGATQRLPRLIGAGLAKEMIYTGRHFTAQEALQIGLVNKVVPVEQVMPEALTMAKMIAAKGPLAIRAAKKAINQGLDMTLRQGIDLENDCFAGLFHSGDPAEGARAFLEKRPPEFKGK